MPQLSEIRQSERLEYIDLCAYILGVVNRNNLMRRFNIKQAWASKDFAQYQANSNNTLIYTPSVKGYKPVDWFVPLYEHNTLDAIRLLCDGTQVINCEPSLSKGVTYAIPSIVPSLQAIAPLLQALNLSLKVQIDYISRSSGKTQRVIAPHALIETNTHYYVRAFDNQSGEYRNFKLNRVLKSKLLDNKPTESQSAGNDIEWKTKAKLTIGLNEPQEHPEAIEHDFGMKDGLLNVELNQAVLPFFLADWNIAPLEYSQLPPKLYPLKLLNIER
jgi:WYL domain